MIRLECAPRGDSYGTIYAGRLELGKWWEGGRLVKINGPVELEVLQEIAEACKQRIEASK